MFSYYDRINMAIKEQLHEFRHRNMRTEPNRQMFLYSNRSMLFYLLLAFLNEQKKHVLTYRLEVNVDCTMNYV